MKKITLLVVVLVSDQPVRRCAMQKHMLLTLVVVLATAFAVGCASSPKPDPVDPFVRAQVDYNKAVDQMTAANDKQEEAQTALVDASRSYSVEAAAKAKELRATAQGLVEEAKRLSDESLRMGAFAEVAKAAKAPKAERSSAAKPAAEPMKVTILVTKWAEDGITVEEASPGWQVSLKGETIAMTGPRGQEVLARKPAALKLPARLEMRKLAFQFRPAAAAEKAAKPKGRATKPAAPAAGEDPFKDMEGCSLPDGRSVPCNE